MLDFRNSRSRLIQAKIICYDMPTVDWTININQWLHAIHKGCQKNDTFYIVMSYYCLRGRRGHDRMVVEFIAKNGPIQSVHITTNSKNYVIFRHSRFFICKKL